METNDKHRADVEMMMFEQFIKVLDSYKSFVESVIRHHCNRCFLEEEEHVAGKMPTCCPNAAEKKKCGIREHIEKYHEIITEK